MTTLAKNLLLLMEKAGMSQTDLANKSEVKQQSISSYISGQSTPGLESLKKLAAALSVSISDLDPFIEHDYRKKRNSDVHRSMNERIICEISGTDKCLIEPDDHLRIAFMKKMMLLDDEALLFLLARMEQEIKKHNNGKSPDKKVKFG